MFTRPGAARSRRPRGPGAGPRPAPCRRRIRPRVAGRPARSRRPGLAPARSGARHRRCGRPHPGRGPRTDRAPPPAAAMLVWREQLLRSGAACRSSGSTRARPRLAAAVAAVFASTALPHRAAARTLLLPLHGKRKRGVDHVREYRPRGGQGAGVRSSDGGRPNFSNTAPSNVTISITAPSAIVSTSSAMGR